MAQTRRKRAHGEVSRERILDAAAEIAGERGYEGTSINLISERSGLPPSSIYWHFTDKDELIAAVIERSFDRWIETIDTPLPLPDGETPDKVFHLEMQRVGAAVARYPDFLRLGLMLILERRPEEPTARRKFLEVRRVVGERAQTVYSAAFADLDVRDIDALVTLTLALADGLFVAQEADDLDLSNSFDLLATAVLGAAEQLRTTKHSRNAARKGRNLGARSR